MQDRTSGTRGVRRGAIAGLIVFALVGAGAARGADSLRLPGDAGPDPLASEIMVPADPASDSAEKAVVAAACCKICRAGKPCGNTCIARDKTCHTSGGCACAADY